MNSVQKMSTFLEQNVRFATWVNLGIQVLRDRNYVRRYARSGNLVPPTIDQFRKEMTSLIHYIRDRSDAKIVLIGQPADPTKIGFFLRNFFGGHDPDSLFFRKAINRAARQVAKDTGAGFLDLEPEFPYPESAPYFYEYVHPNRAGYDRMGQRIAGFLTVGSTWLGEGK